MVSLGRQIATGLSSGEGARIAYLLLTEARRMPAIYKNGLARGTGLFHAALEPWHAGGSLPEVKDLQRTSRLCLSMMSDVPRIRAALARR